MGLSSNILWHQTNYRNLRSILKGKTILCSYSMEDLTFVLGQKIAFPMVSMSDLPFSEMSSYQGKYGDYAIGLSREWGIKKSFNPVWYCYPWSMASDVLKEGFKNVGQENRNFDASLLLNILSHVKLVEGELLKHNYKSYRFYDEREVRFVPSFQYLSNANYSPFLSFSDYEVYKEAHGNSALNFGVRFEWNDVKYIIVKEDYQIPAFRKLLSEQGCSEDSVHIFSSTQVNDDFIGANHNVEADTADAVLKRIKEVLSKSAPK